MLPALAGPPEPVAPCSAEVTAGSHLAGLNGPDSTTGCQRSLGSSGRTPSASAWGDHRAHTAEPARAVGSFGRYPRVRTLKSTACNLGEPRFFLGGSPADRC